MSDGAAEYADAMDPARVYAYLELSRDRVIDAVRQLTPEQYRREFPFGLGTIASTLTHVMISEWYYVERLVGREVPPYADWPIKYESPPSFEIVTSRWREQASATRSAIASERDWSRPVTWLSFPDGNARRFHMRTSPGDLFTQLAFHEVHHRAQVLVMLRSLGGAVAPVEDIDFNALMFDRTPA